MSTQRKGQVDIMVPPHSPSIYSPGLYKFPAARAAMLVASKSSGLKLFHFHLEK